MNTNPQVMAWIMDEYGKIHGYSPAVVTGKPVELGGSLGRNEATGRGVAMVTGAYAKRFGPALEGAKAVIQGYGNVGAHAAYFLNEMGAKVIAVADIDGAILNTNGLDIKALDEHVKDAGSVAGFPDSEPQDPATLLELECDYLVPAALGGVITQFNADKIRTKAIIEAANSPTTTNADVILNNRGIKVVPDILANAGGVTVSYFEWVQNIQQYRWDLERVNRELENILLNAFERVMDRAVAENVSYRLSAYLIAIEEVVEATKLRGVI
jgi:glutamate dehydrogenase (NAD(P)+)